MNRIENAEGIIIKHEDADISNEKVHTAWHMLFRRAIFFLCLGLVLVSFNINIERIELALYTTWAGGMFITLGLWMLRRDNTWLSTAFRTSLLLLVFRSVEYTMGVFPVSEAVHSFRIALIIISGISAVVMMYCLFTGLQDIAYRFGSQHLAGRLIRCFYLYVSMFVLILLNFVVPILFIPTLIYGIFVLINLPYTVSRLKWCIPSGEQVVACKPVYKTVWLCLFAYIAVSIGVMVGFMYSVNAPVPEAVRFVNTVSPETEEIRDRLRYFGMPEHVLDDLPDEEVRLFTGIYDAFVSRTRSRGIVDRNGGSLEIISFIGIMPEGRVRTLFYYRWLELPGGAYVDVLSFASDFRIFVMLPDSEERGMALFDRNGVTYRQTLLNDGALIRFGMPAPPNFFIFPIQTGFATQIQFRLFPNYENQRGYVAASALVMRPDVQTHFGIFATYVHQERLWNRPHFNVLNHTCSIGSVSISLFEGSRAFWSESFGNNAVYRPESQMQSVYEITAE